MENLHLTKSEEDLLEIFWENEESLTSVKILEIAKGCSWSGNYVHVLLRSLQKKGLIRVCGTVQYGNQYARQFEVTVTKEEFGVDLLLAKGMVDSISNVTVALAKKSEDVDKKKLISQLEEIIQRLKEE